MRLRSPETQDERVHMLAAFIAMRVVRYGEILGDVANEYRLSGEPDAGKYSAEEIDLAEKHARYILGIDREAE